MSVCGVQPLLRRVNYLALPAVIALFVSANPAAQAQVSQVQVLQTQAAVNGAQSDQTQPATEYASSTESLSTASDAPELFSASPAPAQGSSGGYYDSHSKSWMSRIAFEGGGGFNAPIGNDQPFITWGGNINVGGGLKLGRHVSVLAEYQFIDDKLPGGLIADAGAQGGHAHIWSATIDPVIYLFPSHKTDVYVTGGGGFYRKVTSFTDPETVIDCSYFCVIGTEDVVVSHFSSNQGGANFGVGFTRRMGGPDENLKLFAEVRYLWIDTPPIGELNGLGRTELLPVTFGVRW